MVLGGGDPCLIALYGGDPYSSVLDSGGPILECTCRWAAIL